MTRGDITRHSHDNRTEIATLTLFHRTTTQTNNKATNKDKIKNEVAITSVVLIYTEYPPLTAKIHGTTNRDIAKAENGSAVATLNQIY